jgi:ADP-L-glycero-D-manno-heptose 6-epimerase
MAKPLLIITGAAGMIGSGVIRHLNDQGQNQLLLVDDLKLDDRWKNLLGKEFVDLLAIDKLIDWLQGKESMVEAIIHLGACSDTLEKDGNYLLENNFRYTIKLAQWSLHAKKRFIYASSAATYGDGSQGFADSETDLQSLRPLNMYGFSKHLVDLWMQRERVLDKVVGLKYFNVFGPNEYHKGHMASMVLKMAAKAKEEGQIQLFKSNDPQFPDGEQCRDFIYVKDAVKMTCDFLHNPTSGLFNIGQGKTTTWNQLARALFKALNLPPNIEYIDMPAALSKQYQNYTRAEMTKFQNALPFATTSIEEAVKEYVQEYLLKEARW